MNVLGISAFYHDAACCLLRDGRLVAAAQEERFSRLKHDPRLPVSAFRFCLQKAGMGPADLDAVAYYESPVKKLARQLWSGGPAGRGRGMEWLDPTRPERAIRERLGWDGPLLTFDHHQSHAASAFFFSGFPRAAVLTVDGVGEWATTTYGVGEGATVEALAEVEFPHSLGLLYSALTAYLGFAVNDGEYKVMGRALWSAALRGSPAATGAVGAGGSLHARHALLRLRGRLAHVLRRALCAARRAAASPGGEDHPLPPARGIEPPERPGGTAAREGPVASRADRCRGPLHGGRGRAQLLGPRALGGRSLLADPRPPGIRERLNRVVKRREDFRPFAPSVLLAHAAEHFELDHPSPFMLEICQVRSPLDLAAITHVDGSARPQTVDPATAPRFAGLLDAFRRRTGCPVLLNTSFNRSGEPIVCSPFDALAAMAEPGIDALVLEDFVLDGRDVPANWGDLMLASRLPRQALADSETTLREDLYTFA